MMSTYLLAFVVGDFGHSELQARPGLKVLLSQQMLTSIFRDYVKTARKLSVLKIKHSKMTWKGF